MHMPDAYETLLLGRCDYDIVFDKRSNRVMT
jgi:hypothetical protein